MNKSAFVVNRWIKFMVQDEICIGRTFMFDDFDIGIEQCYFVYYISTEDRKIKILNFSECLEVNYLKIIEKPILPKKLELNTVIMSLRLKFDLLLFPHITRETITTLAKNQAAIISRN
jgi:hypothetical protein